MFKRAWIVAAVAGVGAGTVSAAELSLRWVGQADGEHTISLSVGQEGTIEVLLSLVDGEVVNSVFFTNDAAANMEQVGTTANADLGWTSGSTDGALGGGMQQLALGAAAAGSDIAGPGDFVLGTQTVQLTAGTAGESIQITIDVDFPIGVVSETGSFFTRVASASPVAQAAGVYHLGAGSPGYSAGGADDTAEPLIVQVATSGGGGGGTVPPDGDNSNDNVNDNSSVDGDSDGDGVPDGNDAFPDDPDEQSDGDGDGVGDNGDAFPANPDESIDTDGDGTGDNQDNDDDGDGVPDVADGDPLDPAVGSNNQGGGGGTSTGPCGVGLIAAMPIGLLGWLMLLGIRRRPRPSRSRSSA